MILRSSFRLISALTVVLATPPGADLAGQSTLLRPGLTVSGTLAAGDTARYSVTVGDDYYLFGEVNQISVAVLVRLVDSAGTEVARFNGPGRGPDRFAGPVKKAGVYAIQVIPVGKQAGAYQITLLRAEPRSEERRVGKECA